MRMKEVWVNNRKLIAIFVITLVAVQRLMFGNDTPIGLGLTNLQRLKTQDRCSLPILLTRSSELVLFAQRPPVSLSAIPELSLWKIRLHVGKFLPGEEGVQWYDTSFGLNSYYKENFTWTLSAVSMREEVGVAYFSRSSEEVKFKTRFSVFILSPEKVYFPPDFVSWTIPSLSTGQNATPTDLFYSTEGAWILCNTGTGITEESCTAMTLAYSADLKKKWPPSKDLGPGLNPVFVGEPGRFSIAYLTAQSPRTAVEGGMPPDPALSVSPLSLVLSPLVGDRLDTARQRVLCTLPGRSRLNTGQDASHGVCLAWCFEGHGYLLYGTPSLDRWSSVCRLDTPDMRLKDIDVAFYKDDLAIVFTDEDGVLYLGTIPETSLNALVE